MSDITNQQRNSESNRIESTSNRIGFPESPSSTSNAANTHVY